MIEDMLDEGSIQESYYPWNSPLFLVPKKDDSYRSVIDFSDHYPLPLLSDLLQSISKHNTVFPSLDPLWDFWRIALE